MEGINKITARIIEDAEREIALMQQENEDKINIITAEAESAAEQESLEAENRRLTGLLEAGYDDGTMEAMARERLGLVMPGETVFYFTKDREVQTDGTGSRSGS